MKISEDSWKKFIGSLSKVNDTAAQKMTEFLDANRDSNGVWADPEIRKLVLDYAYALSSKYGDAAAELACEMYDSVAELSEVQVPPAIPAPTPDYGEVAKAVNGIMKVSSKPDYIASGVSRQVKMVGVDTVMHNALRDGAEWAWIPSGDTCAFCIMLASRGWQRASKKALRKGHAQHIHANCNCIYGVRFDKDTEVEGYDPKEYLDMYYAADEVDKGGTANSRLNYIRRIQYKEKQKEQRKQSKKKRSPGWRGYDVTKEYFEDATPNRGLFDYDDGYPVEDRQDEIVVAKVLFQNFGGDIRLKKEVQNQKNPDYEWMGRLWDLKTISTEKAANSAVRSGVEQIRRNPGGVVLDIAFENADISKLRDIIEKRMYWYPDDMLDIMLIANGEVIQALRY